MKFRSILLILLFSFILICKISWGVVSEEADSQLSFKEVWGYLMRGEEKLFNKEAPITDIFYFSAAVNEKGRINTSVNPPFAPVFAGGRQRIHLVISDLSNPSRMHLCLNKKYGVRYHLLKDIEEVSAKFDGIQIDFEAVENRDSAVFIAFLRDLKKALPHDKILSVAVLPKRMYVDDAYDYPAISRIADRVLVMAYDQHWSTSKPGPVASLSWCREVADYASKTISKKKLIMGLPLYGREWRDQGFSRAIRWNQANALLERDDAVIEYSLDEGFKVMYDENMKSTFYYDDIKATRQKLTLYSDYNVGVGFWRLGMENEGLWNIIRVSDGG
ncbi:MAG TPA: glycosyl hydrolase family 18 protein [Spirochaetota bacterium]|nr:glycosyl hydrolase family 18 protein [Spirochaetota bacterium]HPS86066.1 glycosyl hydrolase family 18 protein [Spirochaetota bacterium]